MTSTFQQAVRILTENPTADLALRRQCWPREVRVRLYATPTDPTKALALEVLETRLSDSSVCDLRFALTTADLMATDWEVVG